MATKKPAKKTQQKPDTCRETKGDCESTNDCPCVIVNSGDMTGDERAEAVIALAHACETLAKALVPIKPVVTIQNCTIHSHTANPAIHIA